MSPRLAARIATLEMATNNEPMLTMDVKGQPTPEQLEVIERAKRTGRQLLVFYDPGDTAWLLGNGSPPWEDADCRLD